MLIYILISGLGLILLLIFYSLLFSQKDEIPSNFAANHDDSNLIQNLTPDLHHPLRSVEPINPNECDETANINENSVRKIDQGNSHSKEESSSFSCIKYVFLETIGQGIFLGLLKLILFLIRGFFGLLSRIFD